MSTAYVELDPLLRPTLVSIPDVEDVMVTYHASRDFVGFVDKIEQGAGGAKRTLDFTYNAEGELWKVAFRPFPALARSPSRHPPRGSRRSHPA